MVITTGLKSIYISFNGEIYFTSKINQARYGVDNQARYGVDNQARYGVDNQARYGVDNQARYGTDFHMIVTEGTVGTISFYLPSYYLYL